MVYGAKQTAIYTVVVIALRHPNIIFTVCDPDAEINPAHVIHRVNVIILALELEEAKPSRLPKEDIELANWDLTLRQIGQHSFGPKYIIERSHVLRRQVVSLSKVLIRNVAVATRFQVLSNPAMYSQGTARNDLLNPTMEHISQRSPNANTALALALHEQVQGIGIPASPTQINNNYLSMKLGLRARNGLFALNVSFVNAVSSLAIKCNQV
ncbi:hypothetical protein RHSIM_Rhsim12G0061900 [Rhododendron simsii]|uniref:Uncharacterized protein n=1 Tax=Rhododendron simsii TaxID=118357 RepID=A0A834G585_RHOSS|nr:hypothetical protein RHSIM_Rhsim12G0061900 [Rhododendron simsii]